jgi:hypothetical protein
VKAKARHRPVSIHAAKWVRETRSDWLTGVSVLEAQVVVPKS